MQNRPLWIGVTVIALVIAGGWAILEAVCGAHAAPGSEPGQPAQAARCVSHVTPYPYIVFAIALLALGVLLGIGRVIPAPSRFPGPTIARLVVWPLLSLFVGFALLKLTGVGLFLIPFAILLLILALWPRDSGPWAVAGGALLNLVSVLLQGADVLRLVHKDTLAATEDHIHVSNLGLGAISLCAILAILGIAFLPRAWSHALIFVAAAGTWSVMWFPEHRPETNFFILPGAVLLSLGFLRTLLASFGYHPPDEKEEPEYPELEAARAKS